MRTEKRVIDMGIRGKVAAMAACAVVASVGLVACGGGGSAESYNDGTYEGKSQVLDANVDGDGYCEVTITVKDGKISDAKMAAYLPDGTPKDKNYGKDGANYAIAQKAVSAGDEYVSVLLQTGAIDAVDTVSGATYLHDQFVEATKDALSKAAK